MKTAQVYKNYEPAAITEEELQQIAKYSRRTLTPEEVYTFSMVLCDNEVDRDCECFPMESLCRLKELFLGKTGIFDHDPKGGNQTARIYDAKVEVSPDKKTSYGEPYACLKAKAYMVRCDKNTDLILEIDAGIKKEVSVGCAVEKMVCSICGADLKNFACEHAKGREYLVGGSATAGLCETR